MRKVIYAPKQRRGISGAHANRARKMLAKLLLIFTVQSSAVIRKKSQFMPSSKLAGNIVRANIAATMDGQ